MIGQGLMDLVGGITRSVFLTLVGVVHIWRRPQPELGEVHNGVTRS